MKQSHNLICPYCGYNFGNGSEYDLKVDGDHAIIGCLECGKKFEYFWNFKIIFTSYELEGK
jgi:RNase P subunit RPR2